MALNHIERLKSQIALFSKPARYFGKPINANIKGKNDNPLKILFIFPDIYEIGMSSYAFHLLFNKMNSKNWILCDIAFMPWPDLLAHMRKSGIPLWGILTKTPANSFDIIAFTLQYELCYTNVLWLLELSGLEIEREKRKDLPLIIAGGPCCYNPAPLLEFIDAFFIGEWDTYLINVLEQIYKLIKKQGLNKSEVLHYLNDNPHILVSQNPRYKTKAIAENLTEFPEYPLLPLIEVPHNRITIEISRGCIRGCRFCHAGYTSRPLRERSIDDIMKILEITHKNTGFEEVSLLALNATDHTFIKDIVKEIVKFTQKAKISISLPSLRAGTLTDEMIELIKSVRKTGFTIAPEAASAKLQQIINKNISEEEVIETVSKIKKAGWKTVKLYFMIGLPQEEDEDIEAMIKLINRISKFRLNTNVTISPFVPKPHTPFQWEAQEKITKLKAKINEIKKRSNKNIKIKNHNPYASFLEAYLSRSGPEGSKLLMKAKEMGCMLDEWSEFFSWEKWEKALNAAQVNTSWINSGFSEEETFFWDIINTGVDKKFLIAERNKAYNVEKGKICNINCRTCGACNDKIKLTKATDSKAYIKPHLPEFSTKKYKKIWCIMKRKFPSSLIGQSDFELLFKRAIRRANIPVTYSSGYNPQPLVNFALALPTGIESEAEPLEIWLSEYIDPWKIFDINKFLPENCSIFWVEYVDTKKILSKTPLYIEYYVTIPKSIFEPVHNGNIDYIEITETAKSKLLKICNHIKILPIISKLLKDPSRARAIKIRRKVLPHTHQTPEIP